MWYVSSSHPHFGHAVSPESCARNLSRVARWPQSLQLASCVSRPFATLPSSAQGIGTFGVRGIRLRVTALTPYVGSHVLLACTKSGVSSSPWPYDPHTTYTHAFCELG